MKFASNVEIISKFYHDLSVEMVVTSAVLCAALLITIVPREGTFKSEL